MASAMERVADACRYLHQWLSDHRFFGRYSVEKLQQFDQYQQKTSTLRALAVVAFAAVPAFAAVVTLGAFPVGSPASVHPHDAVVVVQSVLGHTILGWVTGLCIRQALCITSIESPLRIALIIGVLVGVSDEMLMYAVGSAWQFPVPFGEGFAIVAACGLFACFTFAIMKRSLHRRWPRVRTYTEVFGIQIAFFGVFVVVALAFEVAPYGLQLLLIIAHPLLRTAASKLIWMYARKLNDLTTDVTISLSEMAGALCQASCLQRVRGLELGALLVALELVLSSIDAWVYVKREYVVDGLSTLRTSVKIVEGAMDMVLDDETLMSRQASLTGKKGFGRSSSDETGGNLMRTNTVRGKSTLRRTSSDLMRTADATAIHNVDMELDACDANGTTENKPPLRPMRRSATASTLLPMINLQDEADADATLTLASTMKTSIPPRRVSLNAVAASPPPTTNTRARRRASSVFLTPRLFQTRGEKRLMDLSAAATISAVPTGAHPRAVRPVFAARPSQVKIDGVLVMRKDQARILEQTLQLMFAFEALLVTQLTHVVVPVFLGGLVVITAVWLLADSLYCRAGVILGVLWFLPNAEYNALLRDWTHAQVSTAVLTSVGLGAVGALPLAVLCVTIQTKYGLPPARLLSFVIERYWMSFVGKLVGVFVAAFFFMSDHYGVVSSRVPSGEMVLSKLTSRMNRHCSLATRRRRSHDGRSSLNAAVLVD